MQLYIDIGTLSSSRMNAYKYFKVFSFQIAVKAEKKPRACDEKKIIPQAIILTTEENT